MALGDYIKKNNQAREEEENQKREKAELAQKEKADFIVLVKAAMKVLVRPAFAEIVEDIKQAGSQADINRRFYNVAYDGGIDVASMLFQHNDNSIQIDAVPNTFSKLVDFRFYEDGPQHTSDFKTGTTYSLTVDEINKEKIEEIIENHLKKIDSRLF